MKNEIISKIIKFVEEGGFEYKDNRIKSVYIINSLVRDDFIKNVSDVDILIIFKKGTSYKSASIIASKIHNKLNTNLSKYKTAHEGKLATLKVSESLSASDEVGVKLKLSFSLISNVVAPLITGAELLVSVVVAVPPIEY